MFKTIKNLFASARYVEYMEQEVESLREQLLVARRQASSGPSYTEVAKGFDIKTIMTDSVQRRVVDELAPMLRDEALRHLEVVMKRHANSISFYADVAYDRNHGLFETRFVVPTMTTVVKVLV